MRHRSTSTAWPAATAAAVSVASASPRSRARWLRVPPGMATSGRPCSTAMDAAQLKVPSPPAAPRAMVPGRRAASLQHVLERRRVVEGDHLRVGQEVAQLVGRVRVRTSRPPGSPRSRSRRRWGWAGGRAWRVSRTSAGWRRWRRQAKSRTPATPATAAATARRRVVRADTAATYRLRVPASLGRPPIVAADGQAHDARHRRPGGRPAPGGGSAGPPHRHAVRPARAVTKVRSEIGSALGSPCDIKLKTSTRRGREGRESRRNTYRCGWYG